ITTAEHLTRTLDERGSDAQTAAYLLDALANMKARVPLERLMRFWDVPMLRRSLYSVLGLTLDPGAIPLLIDGAAHGSKRNRAVAIIALARLLEHTSRREEIGERLRVNGTARESIINALEDESDDVVAAAVVLAATLNTPSVAPKLLDAVACRTIVETGMETVTGLGGEVVTHLIGEIYRVGIESRVLFLEAIEFLGDVQHVPDLLEIASHSETRTAEAAVRAIGRIGGAIAVSGLMELARKSSAELEMQVAHAIAEIGRRHPEPTAAAMVEAIDGGDVRAAWLTVLGAVGRPSDAELVRRSLNHRDSPVRIAGYDAANLFGESFPVDSLIFGLTDESSTVRGRAARALGNHRSQAAVDALLAAAKDRDSQVVAEALRSLGAVGGPKVLATLRAAVASKESVVALAALQALFRLNPPELREWLKPAFEHFDPEVVREAVSVTVRLSEADALPFLLPALEHRFWTVRRASADALAAREARVPVALLEARLQDESEALVVASLRRLEASS
ncbi:MAG: HEAT repeat domain-containing protein, partial [Myxococcota bacterium]